MLKYLIFMVEIVYDKVNYMILFLYLYDFLKKNCLFYIEKLNVFVVYFRDWNFL